MKYMVEENLSNFKFWSGAKDRANKLTTDQLDAIGEELDRSYNDVEIELTDTKINDLFWFEFKWVCSLIGLKLDDAENPIEDMEEWAGEIIHKEYPDIADVYFDDFWFDQTCPNTEPEWTSKSEVIAAFDEYLSDNWLDHAHEALDAQFPDVPDDARDDFVCEHWQNCGSDAYNFGEFENWYEEVKNQYENED